MWMVPLPHRTTSTPLHKFMVSNFFKRLSHIQLDIERRGALFEEQRRERGVGGSGSGSRDGDVGEAIGAHALLHEVDEALLEGAQRGLTEVGELAALGLRQGRDHRRDVDPEKAAVILDPGASLGLCDPGIELDIGELRRRHAGADRGCGDDQHTRAARAGSAVSRPGE